MSAAILIIAHADLGTCLLRQTERNLGPMPTATIAIEVGPEDDPDATLAVASDALARLESDDGVLILTDLYGATPSNVAHRLHSNGTIIVVHGLNLAMLVRVHNYFKLPLKALAERIVEGAQASIFLDELNG